MSDLTERLLPLQQPTWPDAEALATVVHSLEGMAPLVDFGSVQSTTELLGGVALGKAFLLHTGSCVELFSDGPEAVEGQLGVHLAMNAILVNSEIPVVKGLRIAGQYGKPRSSDTEERDGVTLPSYRGPIVNKFGFTENERIPDPMNLLKAYQHSEETLSTLAELKTSGFGDLEQIHQWNLDFAEATQGEERERYLEVAEQIRHHIGFMKAIGAKTDVLHQPDLFTSHEALILDYEEALVRTTEGKRWDSSAHMLWLGERTRQVDGAHVEFASGIENALGVKVGPTMKPDELLRLIEKLNPGNKAGRLTLISRMGAGAIIGVLPGLIEAVEKEGMVVGWECDPMHGNGVTRDNVKTRLFDAIVQEVKSYFDIHDASRTWPGGVHLETTGEPVTECLGGSAPHGVTDLGKNYLTECDPRLNPDQCIELALLVADRLPTER
jgi:3-deoxy-7-phosphoheptulonate synthase